MAMSLRSHILAHPVENQPSIDDLGKSDCVTTPWTSPLASAAPRRTPRRATAADDVTVETYRVGQKTRLSLKVDNFATVSDKKGGR